MKRYNNNESTKSTEQVAALDVAISKEKISNVITRQLFDPTTRKFASVVVGDTNTSSLEECTSNLIHNPPISPLPADKTIKQDYKTLKPMLSPPQLQSKITNTPSTKSSQVNFCNNCGRVGHIFQQCKQPITSIGIIAFRYNKKSPITEIIDTVETIVQPQDKYEYLMINRTHSLGYVEFMRGKYPVYNFDYLINIFNEMTIHEKEKIKCSSFTQLWKDLWGEYIGQQYRNEEKTSREKFLILKMGVEIGCTKERFSLDKLIEKSNNLVQWSDTEWGFPKGRRNFQEKDLACAYREFEEETGYSKKNLHLVQNVIPFEEIFTGSNMKSYKHKYFLAYMEPESASCLFPSEYHSSEVGVMKWLSYSECINNMRPYNIEKIDILKKINTLLHNFSIHYAIQ